MNEDMSKINYESEVGTSDGDVMRPDSANAIREKVKTGRWLPRQTFLDVLVDVHCTPQGQEYDYGYHGPRDSFFEAWEAAGAYLAEAMNIYGSSLND